MTDGERIFANDISKLCHKLLQCDTQQVPSNSFKLVTQSTVSEFEIREDIDAFPYCR